MKDRINEIKSAIIEYCRENLNEQYKDISLDVLAKIEQKDGEILNSSRCDIWVASILNIVLEDAEMFKRKHPMYITKKAFSEKTGVSSKTIKGKSDILRALLDCEQEASAEVAATAETVENNIEALNAEEVKVDTKSYVVALRASLRQSPDVILLGEMRDYETIDVTMTAAETGHLVFSTLHTIGAANTIDRIIDVFPASQQR